MKSIGLRPGNAELWGGVLWFAFGVFITYRANRLGLGTINEPDIGFALFWLGLLVCGLSFAVIGYSLVNEGPSVASLWAGSRWRKTLLVLASLIVFAFTFSTLGFLISTMVLMLVLLRLVDPVRWALALPIAIGAPLLIWFLMKRLLLIQLPAGVFGIG
jgi:putative tricarboxylic transport membrane protein